MAQRVRKDILDLTAAEKDVLIKAWIGIQTPEGENGIDRFFTIAGLHGQPFRGPGYGNSAWWGGYCHHGNVLFPTWHRAYLLHLEDALRQIRECENVTLPYWNEMRSEGDRVIPEIFTSKTYRFSDVRQVKNPLYSYRLARGFSDKLSRPGVDYGKPKGYETVRYPFSGLVGSKHRRKTEIHNTRTKKFTEEQINGFLNENVRQFLVGTGNVPGLRYRYLESLTAENYTVFSNTTSATKWNDDNPGAGSLVVSLESPHNGVHLAVGGYDMPDRPSFDGANGDMGENDTASFDPIFFFHHCFVDKVFWVWQYLGGNVEIMDGYPGTSPVDEQGPTPGIAAESSLSMDTPLHPFGLRSRDLANIQTLVYKYDNPDIFFLDNPYKKVEPHTSSHYLRISGIDRSSIAGSFIVSAWAKSPGNPEEIFVGYEPVFSRWHVTGCANCNNHLKVTAYIPLGGFPKDFIDHVNFGSRIGTSEGRGGLEIECEEHMVELVKLGVEEAKEEGLQDT